MAQALELFRWAAVVVGITYGISQSALLSAARIRLVRHAWARLSPKLATYVEIGIYCPVCVGFWVGALLGIAGRLWPWHDDVTWVHGLDSAFASVAITTLWAAAAPSDTYAIEHPFIHPEIAARAEEASPEAQE